MIFALAEPVEGRAEEDDNGSDLPTALLPPALVAKQEPVLAEAAQNAEKFLDAVVKVLISYSSSAHARLFLNSFLPAPDLLALPLQHHDKCLTSGKKISLTAISPPEDDLPRFSGSAC